MRYPNSTLRRILALMVASLTIASTLEAQTGDWQAVQNLTPGTRLSVKLKLSYYCIFQYATDDEVVCGVPRPFFRFGTRSYPRAKIREIRIPPDPRKSKGGKIGAGIGAGTVVVAAVIAGRNNPSPEYPDALTIPVAAAGGAFAGWLIGGLVSAVHGTFKKGKLIYKR